MRIDFRSKRAWESSRFDTFMIRIFEKTLQQYTRTMKARPHFGEYLTIDGYGGDGHCLNQREYIAQCLGELPELTGMQRIL